MQLKQSDYDQNQWVLEQVNLIPKYDSVFYNETKAYDLDHSDMIDIGYSFLLLRNSRFYKHIFCGPLIGKYGTEKYE